MQTRSYTGPAPRQHCNAAGFGFFKLVPDERIFRSKQINPAIKRACEAVNCETLTHHSFRHWFATLALEKTGDAKVVAEWLGHSDGGKLVWALYSHLRSDRTAELAKKLDFDRGGIPTVVAA